MTRNRTCCFECDRMLRADSKRILLSTFCFYFMVAFFTHRSPLPEVDKTYDVLARWAGKISTPLINNVYIRGPMHCLY